MLKGASPLSSTPLHLNECLESLGRCKRRLLWHNRRASFQHCCTGYREQYRKYQYGWGLHRPLNLKISKYRVSNTVVVLSKDVKNAGPITKWRK